MDTTDYLALVEGGIGHFGIEWQTTVTPAARHKGHTLRKVSRAMCMTGAEYAGLAVNKDTETGALPWGEWETYPFIIRHGDKRYARLYTVDGTVRTDYLVDGDLVSREDFLALLTPSQRNPERPNGGCITVTLSNLRAVGSPDSVSRH